MHVSPAGCNFPFMFYLFRGVGISQILNTDPLMECQLGNLIPKFLIWIVYKSNCFPRRVRPKNLLLRDEDLPLEMTSVPPVDAFW